MSDKPLPHDPQELLRVQALYQKIRSIACKTYGAVVVSPFSQSIEPVSSFLKTSRFGGGGVCMALVNRWIIAHAHEDSIWNELYTNVGGMPCIRIGVMRQIMDEFGAIAGHDVNPNSLGKVWSVNTEVFMMRQGVIPRMRLGSWDRAYASGGGSVADPQLAAKIVNSLKAFKSHGRGVGSYASIYISGGGGAHIMCAYLGGTAGGGTLPFSDISFFDPNLGEYWFEKSDNFASFLPWVFSMLYGSYGSYALRNFGLAV